MVRAREYSVLLSEESASNLLERLHFGGCAAAFVQANPVLDVYKLSRAGGKLVQQLEVTTAFLKPVPRYQHVHNHLQVSYGARKRVGDGL